MTTTITAPAKINLALDVVGKQANGYHLLSMIMQTINLFDQLTITPAATTTLSCNNSLVPTDDSNICLQAWNLLKKQFQLPGGLTVQINKQIPVAAGLAGGSTNGAAIILAINREFDLKLTLAEMQKIGTQLGADVPFCLQQGTALATGIGDKLTSLPPCPKLYVLAVNAGFPVNTASVYHNLRWQTVEKHPDIAAVIQAIKAQKPEDILKNTANVLETSSFQLFPQLAEIKQQINDLGLCPIMAGSGGTMLGLTPDLDLAQRAKQKVAAEFPFSGVFETTEAQRNGV